MTGPFGGYFELGLASPQAPRYPNAIAFQSARAAFLALLRNGRPHRIFMPRLICDSMLAAAAAAGVPVEFYDLTHHLHVADGVHPERSDWLLCVNYLGLCSSACADVLARFEPKCVILDHAQAYYAPPLPCLATLYSPRKFFGLADGGLIVTRFPLADPPGIDTGSIERMRHLLIRLGDTPEAGYEDYRRAEKTLDDVEPKGMSILTRKLFASYDAEGSRLRRNANFRRLHEMLGECNGALPAAELIDGPLCYPYGPVGPSLRSALWERRMFVPVYWPEVLARVAKGSFEERWASSVLALPCDQRYGEDDMTTIAALVKSLEDGR
jgi:hypothetical protein